MICRHQERDIGLTVSQAPESECSCKYHEATVGRIYFYCDRISSYQRHRHSYLPGQRQYAASFQHGLSNWMVSLQTNFSTKLLIT
jgi:hypothetical protein